MVYRSNLGMAVNPLLAGSNWSLLLREPKRVNPSLPYRWLEKPLRSNARAEVPLAIKLSSLFAVGVLDTRFTRPAIAPPPYRVEEEPLMTSTCFRSSGAICNNDRPPEKPAYMGYPSRRICV